MMSRDEHTWGTPVWGRKLSAGGNLGTLSRVIDSAHSHQLAPGPFGDSGLTYLRARPPALCSELSGADGPGQVWSLSHTAHGLTSEAAISQTLTPEEVGRHASA